MKKNKKKIIIITVVLVVLMAILGLVFIAINSINENALSLEENKWIDSNKQNVVDIAIINDIPVLSYDGEGLVYDYLDYVTERQNLEFNVVPYKLDNTIKYQYKMDIVSKVTENDIVLFEDNLVLVTKNYNEYKDLNDIANLKLGVLSSDKVLLGNYFASNDNIELVEYSNYSELKQSIQTKEDDSTEVTTVDGIIIPKTIYTKELIENNYKISFHINDLNKYFVLKTTGEKELNSILKKTFNTWKETAYEKSYNSNLLNQYFEFKNISDTDQKRLQSKNYVYGFIDYGIYNYLDNNKIAGINELILKDFNEFSGLSITYTKYNSISKLIKDFNTKEVDFMLNIANEKSYTGSTYKTIGVFNKELVIVSGVGNVEIIDGIYSLKEKEVLTIKDSYLENYLTNNNIKVKSYNNLSDLTTDFSSNSIAIIDLENYNYYKTTAFKDSKINYLLDNNDKYNYIINNTKDNDIFKNVFEFYLDYNSINKIVYSNYDEIAYNNVNYIYILVLIIVVLCIYLVLDFSNHIKYMMKAFKKNKKIHLTKEEKIKYIDQLTSLKNRAYLNSRIESWDESEVYPQSIIVIDLNNVSYINDNYGREEGDKVITEAANILIQHQMQNSEIIRTDGNEFLIYLVGYSEKQIISYLRKLNKELKGLSHGFGAASGYSIITDAIKTIDDAVNEATLDMRENKEDIEY
ncbi:MAG: GGDEF domain-containing protein [Bacilli bacterium]|nr:GGDEF domain-containing protein [Bacilli bacterium]